MLKIIYPEDLDKLKKDYLKLFDIAEMKRRWKPVELRHEYKIEDLLTGEFDYLVDIYLWFKNQSVSKRQKSIYEDIFNYDKYQPQIAKFFMDNGFNLHTCHYCNMAYINSYGRGVSYDTHLDFINTADIVEWREVFDKDQLSDESLLDIIATRPFRDLASFNKKKYLYKRVELYKGLSLENNANHFDLDHLLPKSLCPIIGLSLFNFVPSCQVCNEKLKKDKELADTKDEWLRVSPTYSKSQFDVDVPIKLVSDSTCSTFFELAANKDKYHLVFDSKGIMVYEKYINVFRLKDRYNYHKRLALHILDIKERYSEEKRKEISKLLSTKYDEDGKQLYSEDQIEEDILQTAFSSDRCFSKLRNDMIKRN